MSIVNGQLWIDKDSPYRLKYTANGSIFTVDVSSDYFIDDIEISTEKPLCAGTIVAFKDGGIRKAIFPDDIDNVIGVVGNTITSVSEPVSILKNGTITLSESDFNTMCHGGKSDFNQVEWSTDFMKGAPLYWFIGKEVFENSIYSYSYQEADAGKITLSTPTGRKWKYTSTEIDNSLNVSYDNLPTIGFIDKINADNSIDIYLNVNKFDTSLEWSWPFTGKPVFISTEDKIVIRHGLFPNSFKDFSTGSGDSSQSYLFRQRDFVNILALNKENDDNEYIVSANVQNYYGQTDNEEPDSDPRTEIFIGQNNLNKYRFRITGTVNLKFNRGLNS